MAFKIFLYDFMCMCVYIFYIFILYIDTYAYAYRHIYNITIWIYNIYLFQYPRSSESVLVNLVKYHSKASTISLACLNQEYQLVWKIKTIFQVSLKEQALSLHLKYVPKANTSDRAESKVRTYHTSANSSTALAKVQCLKKKCQG